MLSIGKLGQGQEQYYLEAVAEGAEDYYVYAGEAPGRWAGGGSGSLELAGEVAGQDFTSVLRATHPRTGEALGQRHAVGKVPGFDLTFSAPKSVSLLFALGGDQLSVRMRDAHDAAVADALGYLERTASHGRRGHAGADRITTTGFVAAVFRHRTSRAGDPNLHSHVVVANRVLGSDGRWSALDAKAIYAQAKTAGTLYEASLRHQLRDLGLSWTVATNGLAEIDGVPYAVRRAFSQRRQQIEQHLAERGLSSARAAQTATLETRAKKDYGVDSDTLIGGWQERAAELGFTRETIDALLEEGRERASRGTGIEREAEVLFRLLSSEGLTERASTFGEREVLRAVANALPDGASVADVEALSDRLLASTEVVALSRQEMRLRGQDVLRVRRPGHAGRLVPFGASERRFTTTELLALEQHLVTSALAAQALDRAVAPAAAVEAALARRPALNGEQIEMVRRLTTAGAGIAVVNAAAGSGKTTALDAVTDAFTGAGHPVLGATLSAKAAGVLRDETGMTTYTITRLLRDLRDPRSGGLPRGAILVIDEAGQVGTRSLAELDQHVRAAEGKLILVGDLRQLPEIDAGGAFRGLAHRLDAVELTANHRQQDLDEQARLRELRSGDVRVAMSSYDEAGRIKRADTGEDLRQALVADWAQAYDAADGSGGVVMLGLTNHDVDDLNWRAREQLASTGRLTGEEVVVGDRGYRVGDRVVTRHNDYRLGLLNGQRWVLAAIDERARELVLRLDSSEPEGPMKRLPFAYAEVGNDRLQHGYALTTSLAQGSTVDKAFVLGSDATYREAGYTAASRARYRTQFYVVSRDADDGCEERHGRLHVDQDQHDPLDAMVTALQRTGAQHLAIDTSERVEPHYTHVPTPRPVGEGLAAEREELRRALGTGPANPRSQLEQATRALREAEGEWALALRDRDMADERLDVARRGRFGRTRPAVAEHQRLEAAEQRQEVWGRRLADLRTSLRALEIDQQRYDQWRQRNAVGLDRLDVIARELSALERSGWCEAADRHAATYREVG